MGAALPAMQPEQALKAYYDQHRSIFKKAAGTKRFSDAGFAACKGFIAKAKDGGTELAFAPVRFRNEFRFDRQTIRQLVKSGVVVGDKGRTDTKRIVRSGGNGNPKLERVMVVRVDRLPS